MSGTETAPLPETAIAAYETLRRRILDAPSRCVGELGLVVLLRHGMLAWARTHASVLRELRARSPHLDTTRVSIDVHDELIHVMVAMTSSLFRTDPQRALAI